MQDNLKKNINSKTLNEDPLVLFFKNFISNESCDLILKDSQNKLFKRAEVIDEKNNIKISKGRDNQTYIIPRLSVESVEQVLKKIKETFSLETNDLTKVQIQKYSKNQKYKSHVDAFSKKNLQQELRSQRKLSFILYLNEVLEGGETFFPYMDLKVQPIKGSLLVFQNCFGDTDYVHPKSLHESKPVLNGEKYILNFWASKLFPNGCF